jgi:serine/threonine-protein kinase
MAVDPAIPGTSRVLLEGRYRLDDWIATGGMGEVWRATDLTLARPVAVKLLRSGYAGHEEDLARFRAEARHAGALSHPGIATLYDYREGDPPYLVMELVDGPSLARMLDDGPVDPALTMALIAQAARALQAAHVAGLVHRDVKPGNLLISQGWHVKITDFGIAYEVGSASLTRPGALIGTPAYIAPERARGAQATPAADLYSLGIVAYQCLTGRVPFQGEPLAVALAHQEKALPPLPPSVPADVAALVTDLTAKDPSARPASAEEAAERAEHARAVLIESPNVRPRRPGRDPARLPARAVVVLAAIIAITVVGWVITGMKGLTAHPQPGPSVTTQQPGPGGSHQAHRVTPASVSPVHGPDEGARPIASRTPPAASAVPAPVRTSAPSRTPAPSRTGTPSRTATPSGTPTPSASSSPTGTPTAAETPAPTGIPTQSSGFTGQRRQSG